MWLHQDRHHEEVWFCLWQRNIYFDPAVNLQFFCTANRSSFLDVFCAKVYLFLVCASGCWSSYFWEPDERKLDLTPELLLKMKCHAGHVLFCALPHLGYSAGKAWPSWISWRGNFCKRGIFGHHLQRVGMFQSFRFLDRKSSFMASSTYLWVRCIGSWRRPVFWHGTVDERMLQGQATTTLTQKRPMAGMDCWGATVVSTANNQQREAITVSRKGMHNRRRTPKWQELCVVVRRWCSFIWRVSPFEKNA